MGEPSFQAQQWYSNRDLAKMLEDCGDDDIKRFVEDTSADYTELDAVYKKVVNMVKEGMPKATVEARGSYRSKTALAEGADLDIDLIMPDISRLRDVDADSFHIIVKEVANQLEPQFESPKNENEITRSLQYEVEGIEIDVFIKYLKEESGSPQKQKILISPNKGSAFYKMEKLREETHENFNNTDDVATAVVMLLKWWKKKHCTHLKSYHILLPIGRVPVRNPRHRSFKRRVIQSMIDVIAFLSEGYTIGYETGNYWSDSKFSFAGVSNPFCNDVRTQSERDEVSAKLRVLWSSLVEVEKKLAKIESSYGNSVWILLLISAFGFISLQ